MKKAKSKGKLKFTCPECGCEDLEEYTEGAVGHTPVRSIDAEGRITWDLSWIEPRDIVTLRCEDCGYELSDEDGEPLPIEDAEALLHWLQTHEPPKKTKTGTPTELLRGTNEV